MDLLHIVFVIVIVGVLMWLINAYVPMQDAIKKVLNILVLIVVIAWLLQVFGIVGALTRVHVGR